MNISLKSVVNPDSTWVFVFGLGKDANNQKFPPKDILCGHC